MQKSPTEIALEARITGGPEPDDSDVALFWQDILADIKPLPVTVKVRLLTHMVLKLGT